MGSESEIIALIKGLKTSLSGLAISDSITAEISGQTIIAHISGETVISKISGEMLFLASGAGPIIAKISGDTISLPASQVADLKDIRPLVSTDTVTVEQGAPAQLNAYVWQGGAWVTRISGETLRLSSGTGPIITRVSGDTIISKVSGETLIGKISGETVIAQVSGQIIIGKVSGEVVGLASGAGPVIGRISGDTVIGKISGETLISKISGETVIGKVSGEIIDVKVPTSIKTGLIRVVTAASGGAVLHSGTVNAVIMKADANNSGDIYVGGEVNRPYSGFGFPLANSEAVNVNVDDFSRIYVCATISGEKVGFLGLA